MADRTCAICGKEFRYPSDLRRHSRRKRSCAPVVILEEGAPGDPKENADDLRCGHCNRQYTTRGGLWKHQKRGCAMSSATPSDVKSIIERQSQKDRTISRQGKAIDEMRKELDALKLQVEQGGGGAAPPTPAVVNNTTITNIQNTINFNAFCHEDVRHMKEFVGQILASGRPVLEVLSEMGRKRWGDPERPENGTLVLPNLKSARVRTRRADGTWEERDGTVVHRQAHTALTNQAFNHQPRTEKGAAIASPILKQMDAIDKGQEPFPTGVYRMIAASGRAHAHHRR